ncbi:MAG TPA: DUF4129 domain-containing protein, partial [Pirellulaceae bacterium]|nr:DUF4129 domain-containing protein [Pirellulaceae bacterium]
GSQGEQDKSQSGEKTAEQAAEPKQRQANQASSPPPTSRFSSPPLRIVTWLRWVIYGLLLALLIGVAWWQRAQIVVAWRQFLQSLRDFWRRLLGRYADVWVEARDGDNPQATQRLRSLADYPNPFVTGEAKRWPANKLVQYSFAALEAWGQERNCPHAATQTPLEFAQQVGSTAPHLAREAQRLAEMVSLVAYGSSELSQRAGEQLRTLWQLLARETPPASPSV